jgi:hypothetical protein
MTQNVFSSKQTPADSELQFLDDVVARAKLTRENHVRAQEALSKIRRLLLQTGELQTEEQTEEPQETPADE